MGCQVMLRPQTYNEVRNAEQLIVCESCQRVLYFDPANELKSEPPGSQVHARKRPRPKSDSPQAWFYRPDYGEEGEVLIGFSNNGTMSTRRVYEMHSGRQIGDILSREGSYRLAFPEDMTDSTIRLNGHWEESEMEEWGSEMPTNTLDALHSDLRAAQKEHGSSHKERAAHPAPQPAAS
jgi:hypothetical protein